MSTFPRMVYHANGDSRIVQDQGELADLGVDWGEVPSDEHHTRNRIHAGGVDGVGMAVTSNHIPSPAHLAAVRTEVERQVRAEFDGLAQIAALQNEIVALKAAQEAADRERLAKAFDPNPDVDATSSRRNRS